MPNRRQPAVVLVVHDETRAGEILARLVEREGWRAERAATVDEAVGRARTSLPRAVLVDLPHAGLGSALQLVTRLRSDEDGRVSSAAVVVVDDAGTGQTALATGADAHLSRPAHVRDIAAALHRAISTR